MNRFYSQILILTFCLVSLYAQASTPRNVQLHTDSSGNAVALWTFHKSHQVIQATILPCEGEWTPVMEFEIEGMNCENPKVAVNNGNIVLIWSAAGEGTRKLYGAYYFASEQRWSPAEQITSNTETIVDDYEIKLLDNQNMFITWNSFWGQKNETKVHALISPIGKWEGIQSISSRD